MENWVEIGGTNGVYFVSDAGRVKSVERTITTKNGRRIHYKERILNGSDCGNGYLRVDLKGSNIRPQYIHRLVAKAFIPPVIGKDCINHKDFNRKNNSVSNLEWVTRTENMKYSLTRGRFERTEEWKEHLKTALDKTMTKKVAMIREDGSRKIYNAVNDTAKDGFSPSCVSDCCHGKRKTHKGYTWEFV